MNLLATVAYSVLAFAADAATQTPAASPASPAVSTPATPAGQATVNAAAPAASTTPAAVTAPAASTAPAAATTPAASKRLREGTELTDRIGLFELSGDRAKFRGRDDGLSLTGLENLNLERIIQTLRDGAQPQQLWRISGVVTEFDGRNYLLVTRAILLHKPTDAPGIEKTPRGKPSPESSQPSGRG